MKRGIIVIAVSIAITLLTHCQNSAGIDPFTQSLVNQQTLGVEGFQRDMRIAALERRLAALEAKLEAPYSGLEAQIDDLMNRMIVVEAMAFSR